LQGVTIFIKFAYIKNIMSKQKSENIIIAHLADLCAQSYDRLMIRGPDRAFIHKMYDHHEFSIIDDYIREAQEYKGKFERVKLNPAEFVQIIDAHNIQGIQTALMHIQSDYALKYPLGLRKVWAKICLAEDIISESNEPESQN